MSKDKRGLGDVEFAGKVKTQTFKQFQLERLIKDGVVIPASKLARQKQEEIERSQQFTRAALDEEFVNRTEKTVSPDCTTPIGQRVGVVTREPYEEQP